MSRHLPTLTLALGVAWLLGTGCDAAPPRPANVVLILADDLGYGDVGAYGNERIQTPNLDRLAQEGVRFTNGYASAPMCAPTRAALLTGRDHNRYGYDAAGTYLSEISDGTGLSLDEVLLSERLEQAGYATGIFGKWHLGSRAPFRPTARGFDVFFGHLSGAHAYFDWGKGIWGPIFRNDQIAKGDEYLTHAITREAVDFLEAERGRPFFLYVPYNAVHPPLQAPEEYLAAYADIPNLPRRTSAAMITAMDDGIGRILEAVRTHHLERDTLVIFLSDNGGFPVISSNAPLRGFKASLLEGGIRVPFLMRWTGRLPAGEVYAEPVTSLDVFPTVLAAAGVDPGDRPLDGVDLLPYLTGARQGPPHEVLHWRFLDERALRRGTMKLVRYRPPELGAGAELRTALYDLSRDEAERFDLSGERPELAAELAREMEAWDASLEASRRHPDARH